MSSAVSAPRTTDLSESSSLAPGETCSTLAISPPGLEKSCRAWRSCRSRLQKTGCAVSTSNLCVSQSDPAFREGNAFKLNVWLRNATLSNLQGLAVDQNWTFPAIETSYCAVDDAADCAPVTELVATIDPEAATWLAQRSDMTGTLLAVLIVPICTLLVQAVWNSIRQRLRDENNASESTLPRRLVTSEQVEIEEVVLEVSSEKQHDQKFSNAESLAGDEGKDATHVAQPSALRRSRLRRQACRRGFTMPSPQYRY